MIISAKENNGSQAQGKIVAPADLWSWCFWGRAFEGKLASAGSILERKKKKVFVGGNQIGGLIGRAGD